MPINYNLVEYRAWLEENVTLSDPFSPTALRNITVHLLLGRNYRLLTERNTNGKLFSTFLWLSQIQENAIATYGADAWIEGLLDELIIQRRKPKELKNLMFWMMGITNKTATNLSLTSDEYRVFLTDTLTYFNQLFLRIGHGDFKNTAWLLLMSGSATLNIRGSQKSKIGKQLEKVFLRSMLTSLGLVENENFWMNIERDNEVEREADAEVLTRRGRIRIEVGLIAPGNQEVIEDKIGRVHRNGVIIFDKLGARTRVHQTAENAHVLLIQIRNNSPLTQLYRHLLPLVGDGVVLNEPPNTEDTIRAAINELPIEIFTINRVEDIEEGEEE